MSRLGQAKRDLGVLTFVEAPAEAFCIDCNDYVSETNSLPDLCSIAVVLRFRVINVIILHSLQQVGPAVVLRMHVSLGVPQLFDCGDHCGVLDLESRLQSGKVVDTFGGLAGDGVILMLREDALHTHSALRLLALLQTQVLGELTHSERTQLSLDCRCIHSLANNFIFSVTKFLTFSYRVIGGVRLVRRSRMWVHLFQCGFIDCFISNGLILFF